MRKTKDKYSGVINCPNCKEKGYLYKRFNKKETLFYFVVKHMTYLKHSRVKHSGFCYLGKNLKLKREDAT
jgi:hypothetical protein